VEASRVIVRVCGILFGGTNGGVSERSISGVYERATWNTDPEGGSPDLMIYRTRDISVMDSALSKRQNYRLSLAFQLSHKRHSRKQNSPRARYAEFEENCRLASPSRRWHYTTFRRVHYGLTTHASVVRNLPLSLVLDSVISDRISRNDLKLTDRNGHTFAPRRCNRDVLISITYTARSTPGKKARAMTNSRYPVDVRR